MADSDLIITTGCEAAHPDQRGGQHVAMRCTAVRIRHVPTGIEVVSRDERSQHGNRVKAMEMLREAIATQKDKETP